ncbi:MAG: hypothetical protein HY985_17595 [Magnetospirillum sp.]|nr:hypothetical protein [Magnetospirillum sp.]
MKEIQAELSDLRKRLPAEPHSIPTISLSKPAANVDRPSEDELRALRDMQAELLDLRRRLAIEPPSAAASETLKPAVNAASPLEGERRSSQPTGLQSIAVALPLDTNSTEREVVNPGGSRAQTPNHNLELASSKREVPKAVPTAQPETHPTKKGDSVAQPGRATGGKVYRITINTRPEGGKIVERGGKTYKAGTAILAGPGNHSFVISNPGYQTKSIDVSIADADKSITIELVKSAIEKY